MRYFSFIIVAVCLLGCASKEDKAIDAINKYMYKTLDDYTGYEIVEIKMDSFFTSIYNNPLALRYEDSISNNIINIGAAHGTVTHCDLNIPNEDKVFIRSLIENSKNGLLTIKKYSDSIKFIGMVQPVFQGWQARVKYRSKNNQGQIKLSEGTYILDKESLEVVDNVSSHDFQNAHWIKEILEDYEGFIKEEERLVKEMLDKGF